MGTQRTVNTHNMINACKLAGIWLFMERGFTTCAHAQSMLLECFKSRARSNRGDQIRIAHIVRCPSPSRLSIKYTEASPVHRWRPAPPPPPPTPSSPPSPRPLRRWLTSFPGVLDSASSSPNLTSSHGGRGTATRFSSVRQLPLVSSAPQFYDFIRASFGSGFSSPHPKRNWQVLFKSSHMNFFYSVFMHNSQEPMDGEMVHVRPCSCGFDFSPFIEKCTIETFISFFRIKHLAWPS